MALRQFFEIRKSDEAAQMVWGYASTESMDSQGETVTKAAMEAAWADYMQFGNIREMHQPSAVGVVKEYDFDDTGVMIGAHIVDEVAWKKVQTGVYKGFSIGGKKLPGGYDTLTKTITGLKLTEISLVDRPANPEALITMFKADEPENDEMSAVQAIAKALGLSDDATADEVLAKANEVSAALAATNKPAEEPAPREPSELRKSFHGLVVTGEDIQKGLYSVSQLADLLRSLAWLQQDCAHEAESEGDHSPLPGQLAEAAGNLGSILVQMAQEEVSELVAQLKLEEGANPVTLLTNVVMNCASAGDLQKFDDLRDILKAGARNSAADTERIQKAHDLLSELGAACAAPADDAEKMTKADHDLEVGKLHGEADELRKSLETVTGERDTVQKSLNELTAKHDDLQKRFDALPQQPKGALTVVEKGEDLGGEAQDETVPPVLKSDGTVDEVATQIKKVYAGGGRPLSRS